MAGLAGRISILERYVVDAVTGCWLWTGARQSGGYGHFARNGKWKLAHRHFYESAKGNIPEGLVLDHLCRRRQCVNPDHLEAVTQKENNRRGVDVGRPPVRRLTQQEASRVRDLRRSGYSTYALAKMFGISTAMAWRIGDDRGVVRVR